MKGQPTTADQLAVGDLVMFNNYVSVVYARWDMDGAPGLMGGLGFSVLTPTNGIVHSVEVGIPASTEVVRVIA